MRWGHLNSKYYHWFWETNVGWILLQRQFVFLFEWFHPNWPFHTTPTGRWDSVRDDHNCLIETTAEKWWKWQCIRKKNARIFFTDRLIQVRLLIPNKPISPREDLSPPVCYILRTAVGWVDGAGLWSREEEKVEEDESSLSTPFTQGNSYLYLLKS